MLLERMIRAARLDRWLYAEVRRDGNANGQAFAVVLIVAACTAIGPAMLSPMSLIDIAISKVGGWLFWCLLASWMAGIFGRRTDFQEMMRPVAFAQTPGVLVLFVLVPGAGLFAVLVAAIWTLIASVVAVREAMGDDLKPALMTSLAARAILGVVDAVTGALMSPIGELIRRI